VIEQGHKYAHKGTPVIALESGSLQSMVKVLPVPRDTPYESAYYCWATELVPAPMKYLGVQTAWDNVRVEPTPKAVGSNEGLCARNEKRGNDD
jgi:hypothetical protein